MFLLKYIVPLLSLLLPLQVRGQSTILNDKAITQVILTGMDKMYNFEHLEARKIFNDVKKKYPDHPAYDLLMSMSLYWDITVNNTYKSKSPEYKKYLDNTLTLSESLLKLKPDDPEGIFFKMAAHAAYALFHAQNGDNFSAVGDAKKAYAMLKKAFVYKEKLEDFHFPVGLYNYYAVQYPENHPIYKPFMVFFMKGNKTLGIEDIKFSAENGIFSQTEGYIYLANIYLRYEENHKECLRYSEILAKKYPKNIYFQMTHGEALIGAGKYKEAEYIAYELYKEGKSFPKMVSYVFYGLLNEKYFKKPDTARAYYAQAVNLKDKIETPANDYLAISYAGLARLSDREGKKEEAVMYYKKCLEVTEYLSLRQEATNYISTYD